MWKMTWAETRLASRLFFGKGFHNFFRSNRNFVDAHPDSVVHGIGNRRHDWQERALPCLLCAEWALRIRFFDQRSEEHTSELQSQSNLVCRLLLEKKTNHT